MLNLNFTQQEKEDLLVAIIQAGIDLYGVATTGSGDQIWRGWGGHRTGRKFPILFAGVMLNSDELKNVDAHFAEDDLTYYYNDPRLSDDCLGEYSWTGSEILYKFNYHWEDSVYKQIYDHKHPKDWTNTGDTVPYITDNYAENYRSCCTARSWVGFALAVRLMNFMDIWNNSSFFDYLDRWMCEDMTEYVKIINRDAPRENPYTGLPMPRAASDYQNTMHPFVEEMWDGHRNIVDDEPPTQPGNIVIEAYGSGKNLITWDRSGDNVGGVWYKLYQDGSECAISYEPRYIDSIQPHISPDSVVAIDWAGNSNSAGIIPEKIYLQPISPNPFNDTTAISYELSADGKVTLTIYDLIGRGIKTLVDEEKPAGIHTIDWDGTNTNGNIVKSGIYFCHISTTSGSSDSKKMIFLK
jgi:hypothetical protein